MALPPETHGEKELARFDRGLRTFALRLHYVTLLPIGAAMLFAVAFIVNYCRTEAVLAYQLLTNSEHLTSAQLASEATIDLLEAGDGILILTVFTLIVFGTIWIYILPPQKEDHLGSALQGLTSGKLKEKMASSLIMASAVYLLKVLIQLISGELSVTMLTSLNFWIPLGIHAMFIGGYAFIAQGNRLDPHKQPKHDAGNMTTPSTH